MIWNFISFLKIDVNFRLLIVTTWSKVSYISDGYCSKFDIYYFILYLFQDINDSILKPIMLIESGIL